MTTNKTKMRTLSWLPAAIGFAIFCAVFCTLNVPMWKPIIRTWHEWGAATGTEREFKESMFKWAIGLQVQGATAAALCGIVAAAMARGVTKK